MHKRPARAIACNVVAYSFQVGDGGRLEAGASARGVIVQGAVLCLQPV